MKAIEKLDAELKKPAKNISRHAKAVIQAVHDALCTFCRQHPEFAQAVEQTDKTLIECCEHCMKGVGAKLPRKLSHTMRNTTRARNTLNCSTEKPDCHLNG